ncbi:hypothetical protein H4R35_004598, partial [Dimargaris xerosporica]
MSSSPSPPKMSQFPPAPTEDKSASLPEPSVVADSDASFTTTTTATKSAVATVKR